MAGLEKMGRRILILWAALMLPATSPAQTPFQKWIENFKEKAQQEGITPQTLEAAFKGMKKPLSKVIKLDRHQPERRLSFEEYYKRRIPPLVKKGKKHLKKHAKLLQKIEKNYGIPKEIIVALWGHETNYGGFTGKTPTLHALATLAYDGRRAKFFTKELIHALHIIQEEHIDPKRLKGSWAGAMGQCQFMPSTFRSYAIDAKKKGRRDIWHTLEDVFSSTANYLKNVKCNKDKPWIMEIKRPRAYGYGDSKFDPHTLKTLAEWKQEGIQPNDCQCITATERAALLVPEKSDRAFLVFENIHGILDWNRSTHFALSVCLLAQKLKT